MASDARRHVGIDRSPFFGQTCRRFPFLKRQLGMRMQMPIQVAKIVDVLSRPTGRVFFVGAWRFSCRRAPTELPSLPKPEGFDTGESSTNMRS